MPHGDTKNSAAFTGLAEQNTGVRWSPATPTKPAAAIHTDPWPDRLVVLMNPLTIILFMAAGISGILGNPLDALILLCIALASATMDLGKIRMSGIPVQAASPLVQTRYRVRTRAGIQPHVRS